MTKDKKILIVDDVEINRRMLVRIFENDYSAIEAVNGKEALVKMVENYKDIAVILLDIVMPVMDGFQFLGVLYQRKMVDRIPIILITGEESQEYEERGFAYGIADFIQKPFNAKVIRRRVNNVVKLHMYERELEDKIKNQQEIISDYAKQLEEMNNAIIENMSNVVEFRNMESGMHVKRIKRFVEILAGYVQKNYPQYGLDDNRVAMIVSTSALHDMGKISVPDRILLKPGKLTPEEFEIMKSHTVYGGDIIEQSMDFNNSEYSKCAYNIARWHHERWDGKGYPDGLKGEEIPIEAQLTAIADVFDALVSERVYKEPVDPEIAYTMILNGECGSFSEDMLQSFQSVKEQFLQVENEQKEDQGEE